MQNVRYYRRKEAVTVSMETLIKAVKTLIATGHDESFAEICKKGKFSVIAPPELVNALKGHLFENKAHERDEFALVLQKSPRGSTTCFPLMATANVKKGDPSNA